jgi:hypothetical protein
MGELTAQLKEMIASAERHISSVDEQHTSDARALRDELLTRSRALREELSAQSAASKALWTRASANSSTSRRIGPHWRSCSATWQSV